MKKVLCICLTLVFICMPIFSIDVDILELQSADKIEFSNYPGRIRDTANMEDVRNIGRTLANDLNNDGNTAYYLNKYSVAHIFDENELDKNGADIISLEENVVILHINWIRQILTGFIQAKYKYSIEDSRLLATFVTYYNAIHRKDLPYFQNHYQALVIMQIDQTTIGLSTQYTEWSGNSGIVIPLTDMEQDLGALDTLLLTEDEVIAQLQQEEDRGIEERQEMVDLQERQIEESKEQLESEKDELESEKDDIESQKDELEQSEQETEEKQEQLEDLQEQLATTEDKDEKSEIEQQISELEQDIETDREELDKQEQEITERTQDIEDRQENINRDEQRVADLEQDVEQEKESIERDQTILDVQDDPETFVDRLSETEKELEETQSTIAKTEPVVENVLFYLKIKEYLTNGHYNNELYAIDTLTGDILHTAPQSEICGREYWATDKGILVISHIGSHKEHYLTLLNLNTLEPEVVGDTIIFHRSFIQIREDFIYAVIAKNNDSAFYLGKFDSTLNLIAESEEMIDSNTAFHLYGNFIYVNSPDKEMLVLNKSDLTWQNLIELSY